MPDAVRRRRGGLARALRAAGVAAGLSAVWLAIALSLRSYVQADVACRQRPFACLGTFIVGNWAAVAVIAILAWPLLRLAGVRPAWPVALLAPPVGVIVARAFQDFTANTAFGVPGLPVVLAVSYPAAALLTTPGGRRIQVIGLAAVIVGLYPAATAWSDHRQASARDAWLTSAGLPLLAPDLPGYRITGAGAQHVPFSEVYYSLVPASAPPELTPSVAADDEKISVLISPALPQFAPPAHCASANGTYQAPADIPPCQPCGHEIWLQQQAHLTVVFVRRGDAVVELDADRQVTPAATVIRAAGLLAPRAASYFPSGP